MGGNKQAELAAFMDAKADNGGTFLSVDYDMAAPVEFQRSMQKQFPGMGHGDTGDGDHMLELAETIQDSYMNWLGRSRVEFGFNENGLKVATKMTFK